jgi:hypothetical protein
LLILATPAPVLAQPSGGTTVDTATLCQGNWKINLSNFFDELMSRTGSGPLPTSTINDAPMSYLQAVYEQMGGDPSLLDFRQTPPIFNDLILMQVYLAVNGETYIPGVVDETFDQRMDQLWELFLEYGGEALGEA